MLKLHSRKSCGFRLSKRQNAQTIQSKASNKDYPKLRHYLLISLFLISTSLISQNSQNPFNCETDSTSYVMSMPHPDCEIERPSICLKIKFHDINNTNDPDDHFSDQFWRDILLEVNEFYKGGNIEWIFDDNCIHRAKIVGLGTDDYIPNKLHDVHGNWNPDPIMEHDEDAVNVYLLQSNETSQGKTVVNFDYSYGSRGIIRVVSIKSPKIIAHELGHSLNLIHTFGSGGVINNPLPFDSIRWEFKTRGINKNCHLSGIGDELCDTGADPYAMDLDLPKDTLADKEKWVDAECYHKPAVQLLADARGDITETPWDIPFTNIMSYYNACNYEFTKCQFARMHEYLDTSLASIFIANCNNQGVTCNDIIISSPVIWSDTTIELCPRQKIIIEETGGLTLNNTTLTRKPNSTIKNPNCPDLVLDLWDGIYIMGGHGGYTLPPIGPIGGGGNPVIIPTIGYLKVLNQSVIEYSQNGIVAEQEFGLIEFDHSTMQHNGRIIKAIQEPKTGSTLFTPCSPQDVAKRGLVQLKNHSEFRVEDNTNGDIPIKDVQIKLVYTKMEMEECTLKVVNGNVQQGMAINSFGANLNISKQTYIENFNDAIYKDIDDIIGCSGGAGLELKNSKILNCVTAINNKSHLVLVKENFIKGNVYSSGITYGRWYSNNIGARDITRGSRFQLTDPQVSNMIENNLFEEMDTKFDEDNAESIATCNKWVYPDQQGGIINAGKATKMPESWGTNKIASGNHHGIPDFVTMNTQTMKPIKNYEYLQDSAHFFFNYSGTFQKGTAIKRNEECGYDWPKSFNGGGGSDGNGGNNSGNGGDGIGDGVDLDSFWLDYGVLIVALENDLIGADDSTAQIIREYIGLYRANQNTIVGQVLSELSSVNDSSVVSLWLNRASDKITQRKNITDQWVVGDWVSLSSYLGGITTNTTTDDDDLDNLILAGTTLSTWEDAGLDIYHLPQANIDVLVNMAQLSYRDYTAVLRGFLNAYYGIVINEPLSNINLNEKREGINKPQKYSTSNRLIITPNPTAHCFKIKSNIANEPLSIQIIDLSGKIVMEKQTFEGQDICMNNIEGSTFYLVKYISTESGDRGVLKLLME